MGRTFIVESPDAASIVKASFVRLGVITHGVNTSQVFYPATVTSGSGTVTIQAPPGSYAPPGYYMLFLLNGAGVPSVASILRITLPLIPALRNIDLPGL